MTQTGSPKSSSARSTETSANAEKKGSIDAMSVKSSRLPATLRTKVSAPATESVASQLEVGELTVLLELLAHSNPATLREALGKASLAEVETPHGILSAIKHQLSVRELTQFLERAAVSVSPAEARVAQATENLWRDIETEFGLWTSTEVATFVGAKSSNRTFASSRRSRGALMGVVRRNSYVYPGFQFDPETHEVYPWVKPLLDCARKSDYSDRDVILWMVRSTSYLSGARPVDYRDEDNRILSVAKRAWSVEW